MNLEEEKLATQQAAERHGIDPSFLWGVYGTETSFGKNVSTSPTGAEGPLQFEPETARSIGLKDPYNFREAIDKAAEYLAQAKHGGPMGMVAHYYGAPDQSYLERVEQYGKQFGNPRLLSAAQRAAGAQAGIAPVVPEASTSKPVENPIDALMAIHTGQITPGTTEATIQKNWDMLKGLFNQENPISQPHTGEAPQIMLPGENTVTPRQQSVAKVKGVAEVDGKRVAAWIAPILEWAKENGWKGSITSGYRSLAEQTKIYNSGVRPAAVPGTSNHEGTEFPRGAVDVTEAPQLSKILQKSPYAHALVYAGAKDPVHFSHPHNGSY